VSTYGGWLIITMPTDPPAPAGLEFQYNYIAGVSTNPFTGTQQVYDWQAGYWEASVSMPSMTKAQGQAWAAWLKSAKGPNCVFVLQSACVSDFPVELTTNGSTARYWRIKGNAVKWSIRKGKIYGLSFEIREAL